jgi:hypothetical protein
MPCTFSLIPFIPIGQRAVLYHNGVELSRLEPTDPKQLASLLNEFYAYTEPDIEGFQRAVDEFKTRVPELAKGLVEKIAEAHQPNKKFQAAFDAFFTLCRQTLNPNIAAAAVDEMLVQHLLTERLIRKDLRQSRIHAPQRDRRRSGKSDRRPGEPELQPRQLPEIARSLLPGHRRRGPRPGGPETEPAWPENGQFKRKKF